MVTLVLNSPSVDKELLKGFAKGVLIAVDGGLNPIAQAGLTPHWILGDLDSARPRHLQEFKGKSRFIKLAVEKDYTDLEVAIRFAKAFKPGIINVFGLTGGLRFDHQLVNFLMLARKTSYATIRAFGEQDMVLTSGSWILDSSRGRYFSLFSLDATALVSIYGAKYSGGDIKLPPGSGLGLGNELNCPKGFIGVKRGRICIAQWSE